MASKKKSKKFPTEIFVYNEESKLEITRKLIKQ